MMEDEVPLYNSFDETSETICVMCSKSTDDPITLGKKLISGNITAHHFCLVNIYEIIVETVK